MFLLKYQAVPAKFKSPQQHCQKNWQIGEMHFSFKPFLQHCQIAFAAIQEFDLVEVYSSPKMRMYSVKPETERITPDYIVTLHFQLNSEMLNVTKQ